MNNSDFGSDSIAIFGGTFNPPHNGHIEMANFAIDKLAINKVVFVPCGKAFYKEKTTDYSLRVEMLKILIQNKQKFSIDLYEKSQDKPSYTIETLKYFKKKLPNKKLIFLLGADAYKSLNKWCKWQELTDYAHIVVFNRNSFLEQKLPDDLSLWQKNKIKPIDDFCNIDKKQGNIFFITNFSNANSSINIRKEKNIGKEYDFCNNMKKLNLFIAKENLYNRI